MQLGWGTVTAGDLAGAKLYLDLANPVLQTMLSGSYDAYIYERLASVDLTDQASWDVGAEIGYHTLMLAARSRRVVAFEPNPHNIARIQKQLERNPALAARVRIESIALSDQDGEQLFRFSADPALASIGYLDRHGAPGDRVKQAVYDQLEDHRVPTRSIDSLIASGMEAPAFIKLDVEGAEAEVLRGARRLLESQRPILAVEVHNVTCMFYVQAILLQAGYKTELVDEPDRSASRGFVWAAPA